MKKHPSKRIPSEQIEGPADWRSELLSRLRALILEADPEMTEERKWVKPSNPAVVPTFSHGGLVCTGETYKSVVKMTFARGASLEDPSGLFNSSLEGNTRRAIDFREGDAAEEVARRHRVGGERVESWVARFLERRMAFLAEPDAGRSRRDDEDGDEED